MTCATWSVSRQDAAAFGGNIDNDRPPPPSVGPTRRNENMNIFTVLRKEGFFKKRYQIILGIFGRKISKTDYT